MRSIRVDLGWPTPSSLTGLGVKELVPWVTHRSIGGLLPVVPNGTSITMISVISVISVLNPPPQLHPAPTSATQPEPCPIDSPARYARSRDMLFLFERLEGGFGRFPIQFPLMKQDSVSHGERFSCCKFKLAGLTRVGSVEILEAEGIGGE